MWTSDLPERVRSVSSLPTPGWTNKKYLTMLCDHCSSWGLWLQWMANRAVVWQTAQSCSGPAWQGVQDHCHWEGGRHSEWNEDVSTENGTTTVSDHDALKKAAKDLDTCGGTDVLPRRVRVPRSVSCPPHHLLRGPTQKQNPSSGQHRKIILLSHREPFFFFNWN